MNLYFLSIIVNVSSILGGLNLLLLKIKQTIKVCNLIISLATSNKPSVVLLRDSIELLQIESGIDKPVLEVLHNKYGSIVTKY